ncbi:MAG: DegT/DnrJ/EryC1/StrS family aminotransferase [Acidobacteria bacterium]|nr:DegT/DnrJ/EryC1/StrS family aminotransferase [Acidobacteriota bacterium]
MDLHLREDAGDIAAAMRRVVDRGWFILGPECEAFEAEFAAACHVSHAVGVGNGTDALALALKGLGIGAGDEVVTSPLSAAFSALAIQLAGARPVFADIDPDRLTIAPDAVEAAIGLQTAALLPVHLYGQPADNMRLKAIADRHGLAFIEDCCQAHLATCEGVPVGTLGHAGAFSFYPTKNLGALGDGGAVTTNDAVLAARIRRLRNGGQSDKYKHVEPGVNSRLDELQASILRARLPHLRAWTDQRRALAGRYRSALVNQRDSALDMSKRTVPSLAVPPELDRGHVYHLFPVRARARDELQRHLAQRGIETLIHYPIPIPRQLAMAAERPAVCPVADEVCDRILSLPLHPGLTEGDVEFVAEAVAAFAHQWSA